MKKLQIFSIEIVICMLLAACDTSPTHIPTLSVTETPKPSETPTITTTPSPIPTQTLTPTPLPPMVVVGGLVPCYSEPGTEFSQVAAFNVKTGIEVIGKNSDETYLMVKVPDGDNSCWMESQYATWVVSEIAQMAEIVPTATSTPPAPNAVQNFKGYGDCQPKILYGNYYKKFNVSMILTWDGSPDAAGYRIYKDTAPFVKLGPDKTRFVDSWEVDKRPISGQYNYGIQVYNSSGESEIITITVGFACNP